jgi:hypothetical protein
MYEPLVERMMLRTFWVLHFAQALLQHVAAVSESLLTVSTGIRGTLPPQTPYLLEIVTGRCFDRPPTGSENDAKMCPVIAPSLIGILQGSLDEDIVVGSFESYWSTGDFSSPVDRALLVLDGGGHRSLAETGKVDDNDDREEAFHFLPPSLTRPEDTPGGSLLKDLVFCGIDVQESGCAFTGYDADNGTVRFQGAQTSFWAGVYREFAVSVTGKLRIAVLGTDEADVEEEKGTNPSYVSREILVKNQLLLESAIPNLSNQTEIEVYSQCSCERPIVARVIKALELRGLKASCTYDRGLMHLFRSAGYFLGDDPFSPISISSSDTEQVALPKRKGRFHVLRGAALGIGMILAAGAAMLLGMTLHSKLSRGRYDKIPTDILFQ